MPGQRGGGTLPYFGVRLGSAGDCVSGYQGACRPENQYHRPEHQADWNGTGAGIRPDAGGDTPRRVHGRGNGGASGQIENGAEGGNRRPAHKPGVPLVMSARQILLYPDPLLKTVCGPIAAIDQEIVDLIRDLVDTMREGPGSVGVAAPQIGVTLRAC